MARLLRLLPVAGFVLAVIGLSVLTAGLFVERWLDDIACDEVADSTYGQAEWSWMPPGVRCTYPSPINAAYAIEESPPSARVGEFVLGVALAALSVRLFVVERRLG